MGNLRDELLKKFPALEQQAKATPKITVSKIVHPDLPLKSAPGVSDDVWKVGVTPLDKANYAEPRDGDAKRSGSSKPTSPAGNHGQYSFEIKRVVKNERTNAPTAKVSPPQPAGRASTVPLIKSYPTLQTEQPAVKKQSKPRGFGEARPPVLTRTHEFKTPDAWVSLGSSLQPSQYDDGRILPVHIGIDFGTAYTKVAIRVAGRVFFVPWTGLRQSGSKDFYLPGEVTLSNDGGIWLGRAPNAEEVRTDLKLPFLSQSARSNESLASVVGFLAWVMKYARAWLYETHSALLKGRKLAWDVNLGCPTNSWSSWDVSEAYRGLAIRAWQLSQIAGDLKWQSAINALEPLKGTVGDAGLDGLKLVPEFVAQIAGYVKSPQRRNGLHMLMDIGAGTIDIATFNVHFDSVKEEDRFPIFASQVLPMGTHYLTAARLRKAGLERHEWDDLQSVPNAAAFAAALKIEPMAIVDSDKEFSDLMTNAIYNVLNYTRSSRYGRAPEWGKGVPVFLAGGGSECSVYAQSLANAFRRLNVPALRTSFPLLEETMRGTTLTEGEFHRLSVAYGLTFDADDLGKILAPHQIEDAPRLGAGGALRANRPDRDELYPK